MRWIVDTFRFVSLFDGWNENMGLCKKYPRGFVYINDMDMLFITSEEQSIHVPAMRSFLNPMFNKPLNDIKEMLSDMIDIKGVTKAQFLEGTLKALEHLFDPDRPSTFEGIEIPPIYAELFDILKNEDISKEDLKNNVYLISEELF